MNIFGALAPILGRVALGVAVIALVAGLWFRGEHYAGEAAAAKGLLKAAIAIGNANAEVAKSQAALGRKIDAVATLNATRKAAIRADSDERRKDIIHAPPESDGPLAPVLRDQLDRLPERSTGADEGEDDPAADGATVSLAPLPRTRAARTRRDPA